MATKGKKPKASAATAAKGGTAKSYGHPEAEAVMRPEIGTQAQFKKKKEPKKYRYDSSLSPSLEWDGQNPAREQGEAFIKKILDAPSVDLPESLRQQVAGVKGDLFVSAMGDALNAAEKSIKTMKAAADKLRRLSKPFLNWAGKAERLSFDVPTLPLFVHERLSTKAILETLKGHKRDKQLSMFDLFGDPGHSITDQVLKAYEHKDRWVNRMILGDSMVVMNSLLNYEGMGGKVQMIFMDPPYGVKFGSNFQPFVRKRDVAHGDDADMTREPEMVQAYRDTWELGLHSYLTYMRDRLLVCRDLLATSGSIFVQISDDNVHHIRELLDEVFGKDQFCALIAFAKTSGLSRQILPSANDFLLWYAKDRELVKYHQLYEKKVLGDEGSLEYFNVELPDGSNRRTTADEIANPSQLPKGARVFAFDSIVSGGTTPPEFQKIRLEHGGKTYVLDCGPNRNWKAGFEGTKRLWEVGRLARREGLRIYKRYFEDFPYSPYTTIWSDTRGETDMTYVVQTSRKVLERCVLMTTDPGDLVLDPTCGGGTTAFTAEQWGRRWITIDWSEPQK